MKAGLILTAAVLGWAAAALPGEPVVVCTQVANAASLRLFGLTPWAARLPTRLFGLGAVVDLGGDDSYEGRDSCLGCGWYGAVAFRNGNRRAYASRLFKRPPRFAIAIAHQT